MPSGLRWYGLASGLHSGWRGLRPVRREVNRGLGDNPQFVAPATPSGRGVCLAKEEPRVWEGSWR